MMHKYKDHESLSNAAAEFFSEKAINAVEANGKFTVALSGGKTPGLMYEILAQPQLKNKTPWKNIHIFWGDERCVNPDDPRSNFRLARELLLQHVPVPGQQIHPIKCFQSPEKEAQAYEQLLRNFFTPYKIQGFDLILLGLGTNGHTASLFPFTDVLKENERWVAHVYAAEQDMYRITLTPVIINLSNNILFLVSGRDKAGILKEVIRGPQDPLRLPAQLILPVSGMLHWMADEAAASEL